MEAGKTTKPRELITISSSSSGEDPSGESESEVSDCSSDSEFSVEEISSSACSDGDENDDEEGDSEEKDEDSMSRRVVHLLRERSDIDELSLVECKSYLRSHGLRLSGTRAECVLRIKEHWRIKDRRGEILYPRSSFTIDCTGDVCKGDVVLFKQKVFKKFDKVTRSGGLLGKRTVVGRIVKESYGAAKQQHTFTVEVFWSKGVKELPPLFPLLVKGRNLYRMKTFRQRWNNERERLEVLSEKHKRGAAARQIKEMRTRGLDQKKKISSTNEGRSVSKHQKRSLHSSIPERTWRTASKQQSHHDGRGKEPMRKQRSKSSHQDGRPFRQSNFREKGKYSPPPSASQSWHQNYYPPVYQQSFNLAQSHRYHQERPYLSNFNPYSISFSALQDDGHYNMHLDYGYQLMLHRETPITFLGQVCHSPILADTDPMVWMLYRHWVPLHDLKGRLRNIGYGSASTPGRHEDGGGTTLSEL